MVAAKMQAHCSLYNTRISAYQLGVWKNLPTVMVHSHNTAPLKPVILKLTLPTKKMLNFPSEEEIKKKENKVSHT